jgi:hypothetical protein
MNLWADMQKLVEQAARETMKKTPEVSDLYNDLDAGLDADEYARLERTAPWLTEAISGLVRAGQTPQQVLTHVLKKQPHRWIEAQAIRCACRHVAREIE